MVIFEVFVDDYNLFLLCLYERASERRSVHGRVIVLRLGVQVSKSPLRSRRGMAKMHPPLPAKSRETRVGDLRAQERVIVVVMVLANLCRGTRRVTMTVGERGGSVTQGWSVDVGALSVMRRQN